MGLGRYSDEKLAEIIGHTEFDLRPKGIVQMLDLLKPRYKKSASYGHFGRNDELFTWESENHVEQLKKYL
jgi:S-adenosylmethionine synthetase